jgi:RecJ-like exonuclease
VKDAAKKIAERLGQTSNVLVVSHIDADGISAAGIASCVLDNSGIQHDVRFVKKLDEVLVDELRRDRHELVWFTDLGGGYTDILGDLECVITDHHTPDGQKHEKLSPNRRTLFDYSESMPETDILQVNPHLVGKDGVVDLSGAGATYLVAREIDNDLRKLASLAVIGAVYATEPQIEGLSGDYHACMSFLMNLGLNLKDGERWRTWSDLSKGECRTLISGLSKYIDRKHILAEVYVLPLEEPGTPLHDAKEFATLLNSCGRYGKAELAMEVCKGNRAESLQSALGLQGGHRRNLVDSMMVIKEIGIEAMENIQFVHAGDRVMDSVIGIVAGMVLGSGSVSGDKPLFAFAEADDGIKVSGRATDSLVTKGLDLSKVMAEVTSEIGGIGGGHSIAAGATIPPGTEGEFLNLANKIIGKQLGR